MKKLNKLEKIAIEDAVMEELKDGSLKSSLDISLNIPFAIGFMKMYDILDGMVHKGLLDKYDNGSYCVYGIYGMDKAKALRKEVIEIINSMNEQQLEILLAKLI